MTKRYENGSLRVGTVCYATDQGLGILAKAFYDHGVVTDAVIHQHASRTNHYDWYPSFTQTVRRPVAALMRGFLRRMDAMLFFETPFDWQLIEECRRLKVRTVLMPMYECLPAVLPAQPDLIINPSLLDQRYYPTGKTMTVPVCVNPACPCLHKITWRERTTATTFVHNAGHGGLKARNGTRQVIEAMKFVKSEAKLAVFSQSPIPEISITTNIKITIGNLPYSHLYANEDTFVFPEKFNGLSLPLQEAYASGMLVMCGNRFPMNTWLPVDPMIPVEGYTRTSVGGACNVVDSAVYNPKVIAATVDKWYGKDITEFSRLGRQWGQDNSWDVWGPRYKEVIEELVNRG